MSGGSLVFIILGVTALVVLVIAGTSLIKRRGGAGGGLFSGTSAPSAPSARSARPSAPLESPRTMMMEMPGSAAAPGVVAGGTVSMQWYGLLHCTSGELEGERFFIEDEGFYIGRDPALSKVVVDDSRVSKRHVRIMTRDGKVVAIDQDSTNGTYLNKVGTARITEVVLKKGDVLILADDAASFKYQI